MKLGTLCFLSDMMKEFTELLMNYGDHELLVSSSLPLWKIVAGQQRYEAVTTFSGTIYKFCISLSTRVPPHM